MVTTVSGIKAKFWSPQLGNFGEVVENIDDIAQCITIILTTPRGSDPHRPTFASNIHDYQDSPQTNLNQIIREVYESLSRWEPRIKVTGVDAVFNEETLGSVKITVKWTLKTAIFEQITTVIL